LNCIAIGLFILHGLLFFFKTEERFYGLVVGLGLVVCLQTPLIWDVDFLKYFIPPIAQLFNNMYGSPFPLFPFVGFLLVGVVVSWEFLSAVEKSNGQLFMKRLLVTGVLLIGAGIIFDQFPLKIYPTYNFWYTSPNYFIIRVGVLLLFTGVIYQICEKINHYPHFFIVSGKESLFVYMIHLPIIYGSVLNPDTNLSKLIGTNLGLLEGIGFFIIFLVLINGLALLWNYLKENHRNYLRIGQLSVAVIFLLVFFLSEY